MDNPAPDGRVVCVGGEHEDQYDPDFFIYNDVVVFRSADDFDVYTYPSETFPPTDGHSATLVGDRLWLIGNIGYVDRRGSEAQVLTLDLATLRIERVRTRGDDPGWVARHRAAFVPERDAIAVGPGESYAGNRKRVTPPAELSLDDLTWRRIDAEALPWRIVDRGWLDPPSIYKGQHAMDAARREVPPGHPLFGLELWPVGEADDVMVYEVADGPGGFAVGDTMDGMERATPPEPRLLQVTSIGQALDAAAELLT